MLPTYLIGTLGVARTGHGFGNFNGKVVGLQAWRLRDTGGRALGGQVWDRQTRISKTKHSRFALRGPALRRSNLR